MKTTDTDFMGGPGVTITTDSGKEIRVLVIEKEDLILIVDKKTNKDIIIPVTR